MNKKSKIYKSNGAPSAGAHSKAAPNEGRGISPSGSRVVEELYSVLKGKEKQIIDWKISMGLSLEEAVSEFIDERGGNPAHLEDYHTMMVLGVGSFSQAIAEFESYIQDFDSLELHDPMAEDVSDL